MSKSSKKQILARQIRLVDKIDHNADMGYLPSSNDLKTLRDYENETGIIIRNPNHRDTVLNQIPTLSSSCPEGYVFVHSFKKEDGTFVRAFCRKRGNDLEIPERYAYKHVPLEHIRTPTNNEISRYLNDENRRR